MSNKCVVPILGTSYSVPKIGSMRKSTHTDEYHKLRDQLSAIRSRAGLSQRGLAERIGVPHTWVSKVEAGERRIDIVEFSWFCLACGASPLAEAEHLIDSWRLKGFRKASHQWREAK